MSTFTSRHPVDTITDDMRFDTALNTLIFSYQHERDLFRDDPNVTLNDTFWNRQIATAQQASVIWRQALERARIEAVSAIRALGDDATHIADALESGDYSLLKF